MSLLLYISRMDGDAAAEPMTNVWRMSTGRQAQFLPIALIVAGVGAIMGGGAILYPSYVIIGTVVIITACIGATWSALQLRNSLTLTSNTPIVRTATKTHRIPLQHAVLLVAGAFLLIGGISNLIRARRQLPSGVRAISLLRIHGRAS